MPHRIVYVASLNMPFQTRRVDISPSQVDLVNTLTLASANPLADPQPTRVLLPPLLLLLRLLLLRLLRLLLLLLLRRYYSDYYYYSYYSYFYYYYYNDDYCSYCYCYYYYYSSYYYSCYYNYNDYYYCYYYYCYYDDYYTYYDYTPTTTTTTPATALTPPLPPPPPPPPSPSTDHLPQQRHRLRPRRRQGLPSPRSHPSKQLASQNHTRPPVPMVPGPAQVSLGVPSDADAAGHGPRFLRQPNPTPAGSAHTQQGALAHRPCCHTRRPGRFLSSP